MTAEPADPRVGTILAGRYRIQERLSSGAMGVVYRGERVKLGRVVAIKFLHPHFAQIPDFTKRFEREALTMSRLDHPNCVSVIDFGVSDGPFIVMDFVTGRTLQDLLDDGPVEPRRAFAILRQVLAGLAHAHDRGIIHRDIKPANVMLTDATGTGDHVRILDFGLAKLRDGDLSMSGIVVGTPSYMSPEQASYEKLDGRSDVYSAGVVLFELLTGDKPFTADEAHELIRMHREEPPPALRDRHPAGDFPGALEAVVGRALAKNRDERYQSPIELAAALDRLSDPAAADADPDIGLAETAVGLPAAADEEGAAPVAAVPDVDRQPGSRRRRPLRGLLTLGVVGGAALWLAAGAPGLPGSWKDRVAESVGLADPAPAVDAAPRAETLEDVRALVAAGERERALRALHRMRRDAPDDPAPSHVLGNLYFDKGWPVEGLAAYREAIADDPSYRERADLVRNAIGALDHPRAGDEARVLLIERVGVAAVPALQRAAERSERPSVRRAAARTLEAIRERQ